MKVRNPDEKGGGHVFIILHLITRRVSQWQMYHAGSPHSGLSQETKKITESCSGD